MIEIKETSDGTKIWPNYKVMAEYIGTLNNRNCWVACDDCRSKWRNIAPGTVMVHMKIRVVSGAQVHRFVCDNCVSKYLEDD